MNLQLLDSNYSTKTEDFIDEDSIPSPPEKLYRCGYCKYSSGHWGNETSIQIVMDSHEIVAYTPKGYWLGVKGYETVGGETIPPYKERWIAASGTKRWAYPTKKEALNSFLIRRRKRLNYLEEDINKELKIIAETDALCERLIA